jgi:RNA polymerase sigma factor (sigma-70 family)
MPEILCSAGEPPILSRDAPSTTLVAQERSMNSELTQPSLLSRVRDPSDHEAWRQFEAKYRELILRFCRRRGLQQTDAEDVLQLSMTNLIQSLPRFAYDPSRGRFRDYLYQVVRSALIRLQARPKTPVSALDTSMLDALPDHDEAASETLWTQEWVNHHYRLAMESVRGSFEPRSVEIFERSVRGETIASLAAAFHTTDQAIHKVRQRIRARMEQLIAQQIHDEDALDEPRA